MIRVKPLFLLINIILSCFVYAGAASEFRITLSDVKYLDTTDMMFKNVKYINIDNGVIVSMGEHKQQSSRSMNLQGKYLIPGLIDTHVHLLMKKSDLVHIETKLYDVIRSGVTSVRDMAGNVKLIETIADNGPKIYTSFLVAGASFYSDPRTKFASKPHLPGKAPWQYKITNEINPEEFINKFKLSHTNGIKLYADISLEQLNLISKAAKNQDIPIYAHATVFPTKPSELINAGVGTIVHAALLTWEGTEQTKYSYHAQPRFPNERIDPKSLAFEKLYIQMANENVFLEPTISLFHPELKEKPSRMTEWICESLKFAEEKGVNFVIGTDDMHDNKLKVSNIHKEMNTLVNLCNIKIKSILQGATINAARSLGRGMSLGQIKPGFEADLIILNKNPIQNINNTKSIDFVMKDGKIIE